MNTRITNTRGKFIVFEGIDGSGKSTQIDLLMKHLTESGINAVPAREPSDGAIGTLIRKVLTGEYKTDNRALAALFIADRIDHITNSENGLLKLLTSGITVVCDRYYFSTFAYNSIDTDLDWSIECNSICADLLHPDLTVFLDIPVSAAIERISRHRSSRDLFETESRLTAVRQRYLEVFDRLGSEENIAIINAEAAIEVTAKSVREAAETIIS